MKKRIDKIIIAAIITVIGSIVVAFISGQYSVRSQLEPVQMIINSTRTAEVAMTQSANISSTATSVAQQNLDQYTISIPLPSGHTPPTSSTGATSNTNPSVAIRIKIPTLGIDAPIVQGDGWEELKKGVGQKLGTANPGENGFIILSAYNDIFGELFRDIEKLNSGDEINLYTASTQYSYIVDYSQLVSDMNFELTYNPNESILVLVSTSPYLVDNQWILVFANKK